MVKNPPASAGDAGDLGLIPGLGRSPGEENGNVLQYSCLEKSDGQKSVVDYSPWGSQTVGHDLVTQQHHPVSHSSMMHIAYYIIDTFCIT